MTSSTSPQVGLSSAERIAVRRLSIVRALHLGDLLLAVPALRAIRQGFPSAEITLIGLTWSAEFARRFSHYVDRWREFPGYPGLLEVEVDPARTDQFIQIERRYGYDLVIQMHGSGRVSNHFALALGGQRTAGFYAETRPRGLDPAAPYPDELHEIDRNLGLASLLGLPDADRALEFPILPEDEAALADVLPAGLLSRRPLVGLHPGARPPARRWPLEYFAAVGDALATKHGATIVLTGGPGEEPFAREVVARMAAPVINLAGRTTLGSLAALIKRLDLLVANDTGPAHLAVALDRPSIVIFGPADRRRWAPLDAERHRVAFRTVECSPCRHWECPIDHRCLRWVTPAQVVEHADQLLSAVAREEDACAA